jgi:tetratricopeptide (TPR) repeat protein
MVKNVIFIFLCSSLFLYSQDDFNNRFMLANSFEQAGEFEKAKNILEELYTRQPASYQVFEALNRVYIQLKNYEDSERIITARLAGNPQDVNMYGLLGKTYHIRGEEKRAFETWDKALEAGGSNLSFYRVIANYAIERRAFSKAIEIFTRAKEKAPEPVIFSFDIAHLYALTMNYTKAAEEYLFVLRNAPHEVNNVRSRINGFINKPESVKPTLRVFEEAKTPNNEIKTILAWLYTEEKNFKAAYRLYTELDKSRGSNGTDIYNYGQMLYSIKEYEPASEVFADIINNNPSSPLVNAAKMGYAKSMEELLNRKMNDNGNWKRFRKSDPNLSAEADKLIKTYLDLSRIRMDTGNNDFANEASYRAAKIYLRNDSKSDKARELFSNIADNYPVSSFAPPSALDLGLLSIRRGNLDEALQNLGRVASLPRATEEHKNKAKLIMAEIFFYKKDFDNSFKFISEITTNLRDNSANDAIELSLLLNTRMNDSLSLITFAEAEFYAEQEKFREARDRYAEIPSDKGGIMLGSLARLREAEAELALANKERSLELLEEISGEESRNIYADKALYLMGNIFEYGLNNPQRAMEIYEKLLARFPASMYLDEAREQIIRLRNKLS